VNNMNETPIDHPKSRESSAPLGSVTHGSLRFLRGASNVTVHTDPSTADLYHARFEGSLWIARTTPMPRIGTRSPSRATPAAWR
jgi:hypothetical protein